MRRLAVLLATVLAAVAVSAAGWPTDHGDNLRSGSTTSAATFRAFGAGFTTRLDGAVYGSPIQVGTDVLVATENGTVYRVNGTTGAVVWSRHLRAPVTDTSIFACPGNISPSGITSSPAYDAATNRVFTVTVTGTRATGVRHELWALNPTNGAVVLDKRMEVPGVDAKAEQQRGALAVANGNVYIPFGGLAGDCGNYRGAVLAQKTNGAPGGVAYVVPTAREAGIWAPGGPVVTYDGAVFVAIGNGASTGGAYDYSDSITKLSPSMQRLDYFSPSTWASDNAGDKDLGSMTPAALSNGFLLQAGKSGTVYTVRAGHLGGIGGQVATTSGCQAFGVGAVTATTAYLPCTNGVTRFDVSGTGVPFRRWTAAGQSGSPVAGPGALYVLAGGQLRALSGTTGAVLGGIAVPTVTRFATPMLMGHRAYVGTTTGLTAVTIG